MPIALRKTSPVCGKACSRVQIRYNLPWIHRKTSQPGQNHSFNYSYIYTRSVMPSFFIKYIIFHPPVASQVKMINELTVFCWFWRLPSRRPDSEGFNISLGAANPVSNQLGHVIEIMFCHPALLTCCATLLCKIMVCHPALQNSVLESKPICLSSRPVTDRRLPASTKTLQNRSEALSVWCLGTQRRLQCRPGGGVCVCVCVHRPVSVWCDPVQSPACPWVRSSQQAKHYDWTQINISEAK